MSRIFKWVIQGYARFILAYILSCALSYGVLWTALESLGVEERVYINEDIFIFRIFILLGGSIFIGSHICMTALLRSIYEEGGLLHLPADEIFNPDDAKGFYDSIASGYDDRNSASLHATHGKIIELVKRQTRRGGCVLDLGGGTGKLIAHEFSDRRNLEWHYVDASPSMLARFSNNMDGSALDVVTDLKDINSYLSDRITRAEFHGYFDIILLSLTLTSMHQNPDWEKIANLLKIGGLLIIADIDASYTARNPLYIIENQSRKFALRPRAVPLAGIISEINGKFLDIDHTDFVLQGSTEYSFVVTFKKT